MFPTLRVVGMSQIVRYESSVHLGGVKLASAEEGANFPGGVSLSQAEVRADTFPEWSRGRFHELPLLAPHPSTNAETSQPGNPKTTTTSLHYINQKAKGGTNK